MHTYQGRLRLYGVVLSGMLVVATSVRAGTIPPPGPASPPIGTEDQPGDQVTPAYLIHNDVRLLNFAGNALRPHFFGSRGAGQATSLLTPQFKSLSAGDATGGWSGWGSYAHTSADNDLSSTAFDSNRNGLLLGGQTLVRDNLAVGLALGYDKTNVSTKFDNVGFGNGSQHIKAWTIAPYLGYSISPALSADLTLGYSNVNIDQRRYPAAATVFDSSVDGNRWFAAANLNAVRNLDNWVLSGRAGYVWAREKHDGYTESNGGLVVPSSRFHLGQVQLGGDVAYSLGDFEPYVSGFYNYDILRTRVGVAAGQAVPSDDRSDILLGLGVRYFGVNGITGALGWQRTTNRDNYDDDSINVSVGVGF